MEFRGFTNEVDELIAVINSIENTKHKFIQNRKDLVFQRE